MASEADLDTEIKGLSILSEHPELYAEFSKLGCVGSLMSLLSHENTDIAIGAIQIIDELTDEDVAAEQEQWDILVNAMVCYRPIIYQHIYADFFSWKPISSSF
jgi:beta-catenin-like protein 1